MRSFNWIGIYFFIYCRVLRHLNSFLISNFTIFWSNALSFGNAFLKNIAPKMTITNSEPCEKFAQWIFMLTLKTSKYISRLQPQKLSSVFRVLPHSIDSIKLSRIPSRYTQSQLFILGLYVYLFFLNSLWKEKNETISIIQNLTIWTFYSFWNFELIPSRWASRILTWFSYFGKKHGYFAGTFT